jgi:hypothetical protein
MLVAYFEQIYFIATKNKQTYFIVTENEFFIVVSEK